ncbi:hypothetical protein D3C86_1603360 [compost metagenome]
MNSLVALSLALPQPRFWVRSALWVKRSCSGCEGYWLRVWSVVEVSRRSLENVWVIWRLLFWVVLVGAAVGAGVGAPGGRTTTAGRVV